MGERTRTRALVVSRALAARLAAGAPRGEVRRVLVAHNLLLGDTLMLTPLLAKLRERHPQAQITLLASPAFVPLYQQRPYGVRALPFTPSHSATTRALLEESPFDLAIVPGDNRYSWLAAAMRARHIVVHTGTRPLTQEWFVDERRPYPGAPAAWGDMVADLVDGADPAAFASADWKAPEATPFERPSGRYAVLHVGASTPLKHWLPERWMALAMGLEARGLRVAWSAGPGEESFVHAYDPAGRYPSYAGRLDLAQMWHLLAGAALLVVPDTGIAHLGRVTSTPTVALFGPGSAVLAGKGRFWRAIPWQALTVEPFPCRDQKILFAREVEWVRRCARTLAQCPEPRCMHAIALDEVLAAADRFLIGQPDAVSYVKSMNSEISPESRST
ncbi:MAG: glycosyltransferase family 9 protein [Pseudomonadota bacterium]|nr:glycosyltransferase family 9 protein [Pseudomonadota bacterium]